MTDAINNEAGAGEGRPPIEERGELTLALDGQDLVLRPSFEAIAAFEEQTGKGLLELAREGIAGKLRLGEAAQIACECVRAWGRATGAKAMQGVNAGRVAELILESPGGFQAALTTIAGMLAMATTGGYTSQGEVKAGTTTMTSGLPAAS
jgi:hypothetical protein